MLNLLPFLTKLSENLRKVHNRINKYLKDPNEKQIHDVRTAIRRLDATFLILPKKYRNGSPLSEYVLKCKEFFKVNSEIRDYDIIYAKLQKYPSNAQRDSVIETLRATRDASLEHAKSIAGSLKSTDTSKIIDKIGVTEKDLQKRFDKILARLISNIESTFPVVLSDSLKIEELHDLRISCKKLRYLLELLPDENQGALKTSKTLQKLQDILGAIHDYDFTTHYLSSSGQSSKEIQEIINSENEERRLKFDEFLKYCKRRLDISPDSFLIMIRSLKSSA
ncbi:MAG: CHAD domain-containing protein [Thaumarchaeota archaeon]|nr:MAG: CHAD domain-containing protein [Nitrososphaerota archaeon]